MDVRVPELRGRLGTSHHLDAGTGPVYFHAPDQLQLYFPRSGPERGDGHPKRRHGCHEICPVDLACLARHRVDEYRDGRGMSRCTVQDEDIRIITL